MAARSVHAVQVIFQYYKYFAYSTRVQMQAQSTVNHNQHLLYESQWNHNLFQIIHFNYKYWLNQIKSVAIFW